MGSSHPRSRLAGIAQATVIAALVLYASFALLGAAGERLTIEWRLERLVDPMLDGFGPTIGLVFERASLLIACRDFLDVRATTQPALQNRPYQSDSWDWPDLLVWESWQVGPYWGWRVRVHTLLPPLLAAPLPIRWASRKVRIASRRLAGRCVSCSYLLMGCVVGTCPECSAAFDIGAYRPPHESQQRLFRQLTTLVALALPVAVFAGLCAWDTLNDYRRDVPADVVFVVGITGFGLSLWTILGSIRLLGASLPRETWRVVQTMRVVSILSACASLIALWTAILPTLS